MSAIPRSTLPGHKLLHEKVVAALDRCTESQDVEFKESCPFSDIKHKIATTCMAMANQRDGGVIIIGVSERAQSYALLGISPADLATYNEDVMNAFINRYASPSMRVHLVEVEHGGHSFLAISVPEFERSPIICKSEHPQSALYRGTIYVRPLGNPRTERPMDASELAHVIELAAEKRAIEIVQQGRRAGLILPSDDSSKFNAELDGL
jgi:predicted HTH transcriptional regulator